MMVTGTYAGALALIGLFLWLRISGARTRLGISTQDGGNPQLSDSIRRHANFAEHVPFALMLLFLVERSGVDSGVVHGLGASLLAARIAHPFGLRHDVLVNPMRALGAGVTFLVIATCACILLWKATSS